MTLYACAQGVCALIRIIFTCAPETWCQKFSRKATYQLPPLEVMVCTGDVAMNWKVFKEAYEDYATATELTSKDNTIQVATLKTVVGSCSVQNSQKVTRKNV